VKRQLRISSLLLILHIFFCCWFPVVCLIFFIDALRWWVLHLQGGIVHFLGNSCRFSIIFFFGDFVVLVIIFLSLSQSCLFVGLKQWCLDIVGSSALLCQELGRVTVTNGMWNMYDMTLSVAINATQLIAIEAATVRQRG
jgi:hypothetical protein